MSSYARYTPAILSAPTKQELLKKFAQAQAAQGAKFQIVAIYYDSTLKEHVLWYYGAKGRPSGGVVGI